MKMNAELKKRILSIFLSVAMAISFANAIDIVSYAVEENNEDSLYATGNLKISEKDIAEDKNAMSQDEFEKQFSDKLTADGDLPSSVDNSASKYFPAIGNQRNIGACGCWADVYYAYTYARCRAKNISATGENIMSPAFVYNQIKCLDNGGTYLNDVLAMLKKEGTPAFTRADFETYTNEDGCKTWFPAENLWKEAASNRITSYTYLTQPGTITSCKDDDLDQIKSYLNDGNIITYSCDIYGWNYKTLSAASGTTHAGEYIAVSAQNGGSWHRMTLVGYDDNVCFDINGDGTIQDAERGAFKIANSWGNTYKNGGFCWVSYDALNYDSQAGATTTSYRRQAMTQFVVQYVDSDKNYDSNVHMVMTLNTATRKDARVTIKAVSDVNAQYVHNFAATDINNELNYSLDGSTTATDGTVSYDLNNVVSDITPGTAGDYEWYVTIKDTNEDNKALALKNAEVKAAGKTIAKFESTSTSVDGNEATYKLEMAGENTTTVYYDNQSWANAFIHYQVNNGSWTNVPGVQMQASDIEGYRWKAVINLGKQNGVQVCFNDGNNNWDSRNSQNYRLGVGTYGIKNGNVETLGFRVTSFTIDKPMTVGWSDININFSAEASYGSGDYSYRFGTIFHGIKFYNTEEFIEYSTQYILLYEVVGSQYPNNGVFGTHTLFAEVKDNVTGQIATKTIENFVVKPLAIKSFTSDAPSNVIKVGTDVTLTAETEYEVGYRYNSYVFTAIKDGVRREIKPHEYWAKYSKVWTPTEPGNYTIEYYVRDGHDQEATATLNFTVVDNNTVTIYYNNNSWTNANIHYQVDNGSWTNVPGVQMQASDREGYTWMYTIDLNDQNGANVCFNNGNNSWDSRNGSNYRVDAGIYAVENGNVIKLD